MSLKLSQGKAPPDAIGKKSSPAEAAVGQPLAPLVPAEAQSAGQRHDTVEYIAAMSRQLSALANKSSARRLGLLLSLAAEEAEILLGQRSRR